MGGELVLVTGGSGFIASHCILKLLEAGYRVRTTLRSQGREAGLRAMLKVGGKDAGEALTVFTAELLSDPGWKEAMAGCDYVLHLASPFPPGMPRNEDELIRPAREGALRVLRAARDAGVRRVVLTSSFAAIGYSPKSGGAPYTEEDWTDPQSPGITAYVKSKTIAERAAWDFMAREGGSLELAAVNPVGVFGPVLGSDYSSSILIVKRLMDGSLPGLPRLSFAIVDVRDVADLHLRAMTDPAARGERFLAVADGGMTMADIASLLRASLGSAASRVPTRPLPDFLLRLASLFDASIRQVLPELGETKAISNEKARRVLGWRPRPKEESIVATAESLVRVGGLAAR